MRAPLAMVAVGLAVMAAPGVLGHGPPADNIHHIAGPVIAALGSVATADVARPVLRAMLPIGFALLLSPLAVSQPVPALLVSVAGGAAAVLLSITPVSTADRFGGGWMSVVLRDRLAPRDAGGRRDGGR